jgi:hypothetical protein
VLVGSIGYGYVCAPRPSDIRFPVSCTSDVPNNVGVGKVAVDAAIDLYMLAGALPTIRIRRMIAKAQDWHGLRSEYWRHVSTYSV